MKNTLGILMAAGIAAFVAGCGGNASSDEVAELRKEVASLRAEVAKLSRAAARSQRGERPRSEGMPSNVVRKPAQGGSQASKSPEERKAMVEAMRRQHMERRKSAEERRAQRRKERAQRKAAREAAAKNPAAAPVQESPATPEPAAN